MKESAEVTILPYSWFAVCCGFFDRYPNPYASHVLSEDTVHREIKDGKFLSKRIFSKTATTSMPDWIGRIVKKPQVLILEEAIIDLYAKRLISLTRNLDHKQLVIASESTEYTPSCYDPNKTLMTRRTTVRSPLNGLTGRMIERVCHVGAIRNARKAVKGFLHVLARNNGRSARGQDIAVG
ncbi:Protein preli-like [Dufourea novaeangliae]|uniref:Protein preli-like n=1 Tax=Dufourea novaeangliae TaxID=178035 RepID=A0A154PG75_DUFNO|nr:Protein preli-like [Dufourea novaeangliae]